MTANRSLAWTDKTLAAVLEALADDSSPEAWQDRAACAQIDPELFFPEKSAGSGGTRAAKKICAACEVRAECLEDGLERSLGFGIWGGLSPQERRGIRRGMPEAA